MKQSRELFAIRWQLINWLIAMTNVNCYHALLNLACRENVLFSRNNSQSERRNFQFVTRYEKGTPVAHIILDRLQWLLNIASYYAELPINRERPVYSNLPEVNRKFRNTRRHTVIPKQDYMRNIYYRLLLLYII